MAFSYVDDCKSDICMPGEDSQELVCSYLQNYASACREVDICEDWRQEIPFRCPVPKCPVNSHYEECGPGCERTCQETECEEPSKSGCYCDEGMVRLNYAIIKPYLQTLTKNPYRPRLLQVTIRSKNQLVPKGLGLTRAVLEW